ncbi:MAG: hypothetical protein R3C44_04395 [Chloroflexota bacterium]
MFEQERLIGRLQRHVMADQMVTACYLLGSFGRRTEDAYSDVDVNLIYADDTTRDLAWADRRKLVNDVMPYVPVRSYDAVHRLPYLHIALYSNGTKADFLFETQAGREASPFEREIRILKDSNGWAEQHQAASARLAIPQPYLSGDELGAIDDRFWGMAWDVVRLLKRGDADKPFAIYLQLLYFTLPPLLQTLPPEEPAHQALLRADYSRNTQATARGIADLVDAYVVARSAIIRRQNLVYPVNTGFESETRRLIDRLAR